MLKRTVKWTGLCGWLLAGTTVNAALPDGPALYARHCATCHAPLQRTRIPERSASRIRSAIRLQPTMLDLNALSDAELAAIAVALGGSSNLSSTQPARTGTVR